MKADEYGFLYPEISFEICVNCGLCRKTCPVNNLPELHEPLKAVAAINKNQYDYETTTSGGIATMISRYFIEHEGVVYGAYMASGCHVEHIRIDKAEDVDLIKGSKYVQSTMGDTFSAIRKDLQTGKKVLFIGTPCQAAGLRKYVGKEHNNLYICDIICHGVPSEQYLREYLSETVNNRDVDTVTFREKKGYYLTVKHRGKTIYRKRNYKDVYCLGFLKGLTNRNSCFFCPYAGAQRVGDLTFGDFWGFDCTKGEFPTTTNNGLSCVLINTDKGKFVMDACKDKMIFMERDVAEAVAGNKQLRNPSRKHKNYSKFQKLYLRHGFKKAAEKTLIKERIVYGLLDMLGR